MSVATFSPNKGYAGFSTLVYPTTTAYALTASSGTSTTPTLTAAQILQGLLVVTCNDASTATFPTAALLNAAINGASVGLSFQWLVRNIGDDTLTVAAGTGGTLATGNTNTIATAHTRGFLFVVTGVKKPADPSTSDTYTVYSLQDSAH